MIWLLFSTGVIYTRTAGRPLVSFLVERIQGRLCLRLRPQLSPPAELALSESVLNESARASEPCVCGLVEPAKKTGTRVRKVSVPAVQEREKTRRQSDLKVRVQLQ